MYTGSFGYIIPLLTKELNPGPPLTNIGNKLRAAGYNIWPIFKNKAMAKPAIDPQKAPYKIKADIMNEIFFCNIL